MKVLKRRERIESIGGEAIFVAHDQPDRLRAGYLEGLDLAFPVLVDTDRQAYRAWGLGRASVKTLLADANLWRQYARMLLSGERPRRAGRDPLQLGGDFVVAPDGVIAYSRPQRKDDRPPVGELLRVLEDCS